MCFLGDPLVSFAAITVFVAAYSKLQACGSLMLDQANISLTYNSNFCQTGGYPEEESFSNSVVNVLFVFLFVFTKNYGHV